MKLPIQAAPVQRTTFQATISLKSGLKISSNGYENNWRDSLKTNAEKRMQQYVDNFERTMDWERRQNLDPFTDGSGQFYNPSLQYNLHQGLLQRMENYHNSRR